MDTGAREINARAEVYLEMKIEISKELASFTANHLRKRAERQKKMMPDPDYQDPWLQVAPEHRAEERASALEAVRKAKEFIKNCEAVIAILESK